MVRSELTQNQHKKKENLILTVLRRSVQRAAGPISAASNLYNTAPKDRRSGSEPLLCLI